MKAIRLTRAALCLLVVLGTACARKPASIQISPRKVVLYGIDRSQRLTAQILDKKGQAVESIHVVWASAKPDIAAIDNAGRIVAKGGGKTMVTATFGDLKSQVPVEVVDAAAIEVVPAQATLIGPTGTSFTLTAVVKSSKKEAVSLRPTWSSSDEKVAKVSQDGVVTSVGNGTTGVTAHLGDLQAVAEVTVLVREIARLEVHPATALVRVGDSQRFEVVAFAPDGSRLENAVAQFRSSNPAVATINGGGIASGVGAGTATIHVDVAGRVAEATLIVN